MKNWSLFKWFYLDDSTNEVIRYRFGWKFTILKICQYISVAIVVIPDFPIQLRYTVMAIAVILTGLNISLFYSLGISSFRKEMKNWVLKGNFLKGDLLIEKQRAKNSPELYKK